MRLSFFSFKNREKSDKAEAPRHEGTAENTQSSVAVAEKPEEWKTPPEQEAPRKMVLDPQHLTPETLEAFFPSERNLAG
jgi:hypothetical protein